MTFATLRKEGPARNSLGIRTTKASSTSRAPSRISELRCRRRSTRSFMAGATSLGSAPFVEKARAGGNAAHFHRREGREVRPRGHQPEKIICTGSTTAPRGGDQQPGAKVPILFNKFNNALNHAGGRSRSRPSPPSSSTTRPSWSSSSARRRATSPRRTPSRISSAMPPGTTSPPATCRSRTSQWMVARR